MTNFINMSIECHFKMSCLSQIIMVDLRQLPESKNALLMKRVFVGRTSYRLVFRCAGIDPLPDGLQFLGGKVPKVPAFALHLE